MKDVKVTVEVDGYTATIALGRFGDEATAMRRLEDLAAAMTKSAVGMIRTQLNAAREGSSHEQKSERSHAAEDTTG